MAAEPKNIFVECDCGEIHQFDSQLVGRKATCPTLGQPFIVPPESGHVEFLYAGGVSSKEQRVTKPEPIPLADPPKSRSQTPSVLQSVLVWSVILGAAYVQIRVMGTCDEQPSTPGVERSFPWMAVLVGVPVLVGFVTFAGLLIFYPKEVFEFVFEVVLTWCMGIFFFVLFVTVCLWIFWPSALKWIWEGLTS